MATAETLLGRLKRLAQGHWFKRLIALLVAFALGVGVGAHQCYKYINSSKTEFPDAPTLAVTVPTPTEKPFTLTVSHVEEIIAPASDLITTKYTYKDADVYEDYKEFFHVRMPITTNKVVFTYSGTVGIGIDLSKLDLCVDNEGKRIAIILPELEVKYNEIDADSFEYYNVSISIFNQLKLEDCTDLIATLLAAKKEQVLNDKSVMDGARKNTELVLRSLLSTSELTRDYKVAFK